MEAEHILSYDAHLPTVNLWQVSSLVEVDNKTSQLSPLSTLIYSPETFALLSFDSFFPDLYYITPEYESTPYQTFLKYSLFRMGLKEHELWEMFTTNIEHYQDYKEPEINYSNEMWHQGRKINMATLSEDERFTLLNEFSYDQLTKYQNLEMVWTMNHASTPSRKLHYPEPFVASPSFTHTDIGFIHVLHYQYWLWFFFIFLIVFFFLAFLCTVRWCNMRVKPRRETRGVSRSKCGDLITACVPVSWAISIIVTETTDATDMYDGFGAAELTLGVRAYQWGWEYYYPKNLDLNYNVRTSYSTFAGKSLQYSVDSSEALTRNDLWRFYQNRKTDAVTTPAHLLLLPLDNKQVINFFSLSTAGLSSLKESTAFKKITTASKALAFDLNSTGVTYVPRYRTLHRLFLSDNTFLKAANFSLIRPHNTLASKATGRHNQVVLDNQSCDKFLTYNNYQNNPNTTPFLLNKLRVEQSAARAELGQFTTQPTTALATTTLNKLDNVLAANPGALRVVNQSNDTAFVQAPLEKVFNKAYNTRGVLNALPSTLGSLEDFRGSSSSSFAKFSVETTTTSPQRKMIAASDQQILAPEQSVRQFATNAEALTKFNFPTTTSSPTTATLADPNIDSLFNATRTSWADPTTWTKLATTRVFFEAPYSPILSNNNRFSALNYDASNQVFTRAAVHNREWQLTSRSLPSDDIYLLRGKRDGAPKFLTTAYWTQFLAQTSPELRLTSLKKVADVESSLVVPVFTNYYDYDFRNLQAYELLEDLFWEAHHSAYTHLEYLNLADTFSKASTLSGRDGIREPFFTLTNIGVTPAKEVSTGSVAEGSITGLGLQSVGVVFDDYVTTFGQLSTDQASTFQLAANLFNLEDSYEQLVESRSLLSNYSANFFLLLPKFNQLSSYLTNFNMFNSEFEDWASLVTNIKGIETVTLDGLTTPVTNSLLVPTEARWGNFLSLRSPVRSSIVTFNALQKVFRARFEDGRAHSSLQNFAKLGTEQPFLGSPRPSYESLLGKTKRSFFTINFYNPTLNSLSNVFSSLDQSVNSFFFNFPFLLSAKSDMGRYMWFDWSAKWGSLELQASSVSRYSTLGVPYIRKPFDFNGESSDSISETETYLTRISRARKNYLPNWTYTPYIYARNTSWLNPSTGAVFDSSALNSYSQVRMVLNQAGAYSSTVLFVIPSDDSFQPTSSGLNTYVKSAWRPFSSIQSYYFTLSTLADYLSKREVLYRQFFSKNNALLCLPTELRATANNSLLEEVERSYNFNDPIALKAEADREVFYFSTPFFKFLLMTKCLNSLVNVPINLTSVYEFLNFYGLGTQSSQNNLGAWELTKNQHRPLRKGISSMLRLHATGAIAMPIEVRLQILASSRDVIHSWSIPSAGIKIDCVPGYTSHRIMIFLMEGIYWGQCMEICGRYHHWMPIVLYLMKRDLFFLWCTHFIFNNTLTTMFDTNDRQFGDYLRFVSFDTLSWLNEFYDA